ncbi:putative NBD/HSP70 family sugar kinase [Anaerotaenia torta]|uniref:ROK family protein n=1 Tax=Anaerotaenia torta TaxID=433293 RepID=UPI003D21A56D
MYSIGIDIGGISAKIGVVQKQKLKLNAVRTVPTNSSMEYEVFLSQVFTAMEELTEEAGRDGLDMVGISSCGLIDSREGRITYSNNIRWENKSIVSDVGGRWQVPVKIANDAKCALLAEALYGAGRGFDRVCMITLGTGVGGGFMTGGRLDTGTLHGDASGILGHMTVEAGGRQCTCGRRGCLEAYASSSALMASYRERTGMEITTKEIFHRVRCGEEGALTVFHEFCYYLGEGLVSFGNILRPEIIIIGGGISNSADLFIDVLSETVSKGVYGGEAIPIRIAAAVLGNDAGMIGATLL